MLASPGPRIAIEQFPIMRTQLRLKSGSVKVLLKDLAILLRLVPSHTNFFLGVDWKVAFLGSQHFRVDSVTESEGVLLHSDVNTRIRNRVAAFI